MKKMEYIIRRAGTDDIEKIDFLMWNVYENLSEKNIFVPDDKIFIEKHIEKEGFILIAEKKEDASSLLAAFLIVRFPENEEDNLGSYLKLSTEELQNVAHMESAVVDKNCRGAHLQQRLLEAAEQEIMNMYWKEEKRYYLMCTIDPNNNYSLNNAKKMGYTVVDEVEKYGGKRRAILCKTVKK